MGFAIWEQFYSSHANGQAFGNRNDQGSTCILHSNAIVYNGTHPNANVWIDQDIDSLARNPDSITMGGKVKSVENRMVIFPSDLYHQGFTCSDKQRKVVINFNFDR